MKYVSLLVIIILSACAASHSRPASPAEVKSTPSVSSSSSANPPAEARNSPVRGIDFKNFTFDWYPAGLDVPATGRKIVLKDGSMKLGSGAGQDPQEFFLIEDGVKYGDVTGDGKEEAVVVLGMISSGTARPNLIFVYTMSNEKPERLWVYETGDRWSYGYHDASTKDGQLLIERYKPKIIEYQGQEHDMSQSEAYIRDYYSWDGTQFSKVKTEELPVDPGDSNPWVTRGR